jgi:hypothetical protein
MYATQGKYMEILFNKQNKIMGGRTTKYLLEKVSLLALSAHGPGSELWTPFCRPCSRE